ncbi:hypothetical protein ADIWIN_0803 [Winogradskyella psychrotolerans RS-3]|uniref:Selenophosphate synthetase n=1 Tax=Winogradskyella psychrotolerans RS-3 TaxID=641526 RepID=S7VVW2_9FLAO|nr:hypothetical protein [Winogradskyella psychrotolerans]EPR74226.1 hypothetical protein ADIWIN_0803 [Winogradskyella psychrotolerans RS-3]
MKSLYIGLICLVFVSNCKSDPEQATLKVDKQELSIAEKIANAHGFEHWKNVSEVKFTFQVDTDSRSAKGRAWSWFPKSNEVLFESLYGEKKYSRSDMDSTQIANDRGFINDKFWLFVPFQLVWDTSATISESKKAQALISKTELNMITLTYPNEGGYTPGDAYDIFYDNDYIIREWIYRKGNVKEPSLITTFENYKDYNGIKIATEHRQENGSWNLNFTDVSITLDDQK